MSLSIGAIGAVNSGQSLYSVLSPYLNGVVRTSDAATVAQAEASAQTASAAATQSAIAAQGDATAAALTAPFDNPAIAAIGERLALGQALSATTGITPDALLSSTTLNSLTGFNSLNAPAGTTQTISPTDSVLTGDSGTVVQSNAAALFAISTVATQVAALTQFRTPAVSPAAIVSPIQRPQLV